MITSFRSLLHRYDPCVHHLTNSSSPCYSSLLVGIGWLSLSHPSPGTQTCWPRYLFPWVPTTYLMGSRSPYHYVHIDRDMTYRSSHTHTWLKLPNLSQLSSVILGIPAWGKLRAIYSVFSYPHPTPTTIHSPPPGLLDDGGGGGGDV